MKLFGHFFVDIFQNPTTHSHNYLTYQLVTLEKVQPSIGQQRTMAIDRWGLMKIETNIE